MAEHGITPSDPDREQHGPDSQLVLQFLEHQREEIALRRDELDLRGRHVEKDYQLSHAALEANREDRRDRRTEARSKRREHLAFATFGALLLSIVLIILVSMDERDIATELLRTVIVLGTGGAGGYFIGRHQQTRNDSDRPT